MYHNRYVLELMIMAILEITSREFRDRQRAIFDLADEGERIVIRRGKKRSYVLTPLNDDALELSSSMKETIEQGLENIRQGKTKRYTLEELRTEMGL